MTLKAFQVNTSQDRQSIATFVRVFLGDGRDIRAMWHVEENTADEIEAFMSGMCREHSFAADDVQTVDIFALDWGSRDSVPTLRECAVKEDHTLGLAVRETQQ